MPRWDINYNYCVLRSISFNLDYYWCLKNKEESKVSAQFILLNDSTILLLSLIYIYNK